MTNTTIPLLHIYAQSYQHQPAVIIGNREALELLHEAIDRAIRGHDNEAVAFAKDGEGYGAIVLLTDDDEFRKTPLPYTDPEFERGGFPENIMRRLVSVVAPPKGERK